MFAYIYTADGLVQVNKLSHHGVKGQKRGVRRYRGKAGTYIKKGLEKWDKAEAKYDSVKATKDKVKADYKTGAANKQTYKEAKGKLKEAKWDLKGTYKKLKADKMADQGKIFIGKVRPFRDHSRALKISNAAVSAGSVVLYGVLSRYKDQKTAALASSAVALGGAAVNGILSAKFN